MKVKPKFGQLEIGSVPRVVGTVTDGEFLKQLLRLTPPCDLVEARLDQIGVDKAEALEHCRNLQDKGIPVFATLRLKIEGGLLEDNGERLKLFAQALENTSGIDVEFRSKFSREVAGLARSNGKACIVSFHDFEKTPPAQELTEILNQAQKFASVVKISTMINSSADVETLRGLLRKSWNVPICLIGMGPLGRETRLNFPLEGSCLTYGYLDKPAAPGQLSAADLVHYLRSFER